MEGELLKWTDRPKVWTKMYCVIKERFLCFHYSQEDHKSGMDPVESIDLSECAISEHSLESNQFSLSVYSNSTYSTFKSPLDCQVQAWVEAIKSVAGGNTISTPSSSSNRSSKDDLSLKSSTFKKSKSNGDERELTQCQGVAITKSKFDQACARLSCTLPRHNPSNDAKKLRKSASKRSKTPTMTLKTGFLDNPPNVWLEPGPKTFFSSLRHTFSGVRKSIRHTRTGIPLVSFSAFIEACSDYAILFDRLDNTVLVPIKADMVAGIHRLELNKTMSLLPGDSLLAAVQNEVEENKIQGIDSSAQTLVWLLRTLKAMNIFAINLMDMQSPTFRHTNDSFLDAYEKVLLRHHNWLAQKMFKAGMKFVSPYETIIRTLIEPKYQGLSFDEMEALLSIECLQYNVDLTFVLEELSVYFTSIGLDV